MATEQYDEVSREYREYMRYMSLGDEYVQKGSTKQAVYHYGRAHQCAMRLADLAHTALTQCAHALGDTASRFEDALKAEQAKQQLKA